MVAAGAAVSATAVPVPAVPVPAVSVPDAAGATDVCAVEPAEAAGTEPDSGRPPAKAYPPADMTVPAIKETQNRRITHDPLTITSGFNQPAIKHDRTR